MIAIKNLEEKELVVSFNGNDYFFPKEAIVLVDQEVVEHLQEVYPLAFDFEVSLPKDEQVAKVRTVKTKSLISPIELDNRPARDMKITRGEFTDFETQGADFYGPGAEIENI